MSNEAKPGEQLLHLVIGGEVVTPNSLTFANLQEVDLVGVYPDYQSAEEAWRGKAQATVDNASMRYFVVHLHRLLDPDALVVGGTDKSSE
ncbi:MAG: DUF4170 domain-containing protein [Pseudomonadota bacterium]